MRDLQARLQAALGDAYRVEKELGGGGMSRVFLAQEATLRRRVVIKVLPPEMAAGVNAERFRREIELAASLQHPHIVPLHAAGQAGDLLYYTMPFIEGESLRTKLTREGELPVGETIRILTDVADALAYAHAHGVVHRDIKPDNVLLSGKHAMVTDFGVSKAVSASSGGGSLTSLGVALGTPAYMAPEQAAADPHVDHRADLYALGALGYEMLTGGPPFTAATPQAMLAAQVTKKPEPVTAHREAIPAALNALVMRCLEKHPADRWQNGTEVLQQLEAMVTPSGGMAPTGEALPLSSGTRMALRRAHPLRVAGWFALAGLGVLGAVDLLVRGLGLPDWVLYGALGLLGVGLPITLVTGLIERRRILASTGRVPPSRETGVTAWLSWRKALLGGVVAFAGLGAVTAVYMAMRLLGIGPVGTLEAAGKLKARDLIVLTDFTNRTSDSTLGPTLTEAFRVDLSQSRTVKLADPQAIAATLVRMEQRPTTPFTAGVAQEVAQRSGAKAIVTGEVNPAGTGYVLTAGVASAADGQVLTAVRAEAADAGHLLPALDRLSSALRERIGESLRTIRASVPLEQVTTRSLEAFHKYTEARRVGWQMGDYPRAIGLLHEAIALDSEFAMAYRTLAAALDNSGRARSEVLAARSHAYALRERLPPAERYLIVGEYRGDVGYDLDKAIDAFRSGVDYDSALIGWVGFVLRLKRQCPAAESLLVRASVLVPWNFAPYANAISCQVTDAHLADAQATMNRWTQAMPGNPYRLAFAGALAAALGRDDSAVAVFGEAERGAEGNPAVQSWSALEAARVDEMGGRLARAVEERRRAMATEGARGLPGRYLEEAASLARLDLRYPHRARAALQALGVALAQYPLAAVPPLDRPYSALAMAYAEAGRVAEARRLGAEYVRAVPESLRRAEPDRYGAEAAIALAEGRPRDAIAAARAWNAAVPQGLCSTCGLFELAEAYDRAGERDSALATYERFVTSEHFRGVAEDSYAFAPSYIRLGELYEARGDRAKAREYYGQLLDLWKKADPEVQPIVRDVRGRMARLAGEH